MQDEKTPCIMSPTTMILIYFSTLTSIPISHACAPHCIIKTRICMHALCLFVSTSRFRRDRKCVGWLSREAAGAWWKQDQARSRGA